MRSTPAAPGSYRYWKFLDGLRGFALVLVLGIHSRLPFMMGGFIGLDLFFVLSGFLITTMLIEEWTLSGRIRLRDFYLRRAFRLLPALFVTVAAVVVYGILWLPPLAAAAITRSALYTFFYVLNWATAYGWVPMTMLSHTWSLSVEEQFYLLWPLLLIGVLWLPINRLSRVAIVLAGVGASVGVRAWLLWAGAGPVRTFAGIDTRADGLLLGCALAMLVYWQMLPRARWFVQGARVATAVAACVILALTVVLHTEGGRPTGIFAASLTGAVLILGMLVSPGTLAQRVLEWPVFVWLGRRSYSIYLWHFPIFVALLPLLGWPNPTAVWPAEIKSVAPRLALSIVVAIASYEWIERPCMRLRARWSHVQAARGATRVATTAAASPIVLPGDAAEVLE